MDNVDWSQQAPKFVHDTSKFWYKPHINRDEIIRLLQDKPSGTFIVRDSTTYPGAFGLAVKVDQVPANVVVKGDDVQSELIRHYLIEPTSKGVRIKGCTNEPTFASLAALIYQHSITSLALPCKLLLNERGDSFEELLEAKQSDTLSSTAVTNGAACNVLFINSVELESLTGPEAIQKIVDETMKGGQTLKTAVVQFKAASSGITITDMQRKLFFRRHFPIATVTFAGLDPQGRKWSHTLDGIDSKATLKLFGLVAKKHPSAPDNVGHVFADMDTDQPASAIVTFIQKLLIGQGKAFKP